jgi:hypothetical protein
MHFSQVAIISTSAPFTRRGLANLCCGRLIFEIKLKSSGGADHRRSLPLVI